VAAVDLISLQAPRQLPTQITYGELREAASKLAAALGPRLALNGQCLGVLATHMRRGVEWYCVFCAASQLQAPIVARTWTHGVGSLDRARIVCRISCRTFGWQLNVQDLSRARHFFEKDAKQAQTTRATRACHEFGRIADHNSFTQSHRWLVLWVEADIGPLEHVMQKSTPRGRPEYSEGSLIRGTAKCGKMKWVEFDGTKLHLRQGDRSHLDQGDAQAHNPNLQGTSSPAAASKDPTSKRANGDTAAQCPRGDICKR